jgi:hypothetical protein
MRHVLRAAPLNIRQMADALEVEPEAVVVGLRELRSSKRGRLRSSVILGHVAWQWYSDDGGAALDKKRKRKSESRRKATPPAKPTDSAATPDGRPTPGEPSRTSRTMSPDREEA